MIYNLFAQPNIMSRQIFRTSVLLVLICHLFFVQSTTKLPRLSQPTTKILRSRDSIQPFNKRIEGLIYPELITISNQQNDLGNITLTWQNQSISSISKTFSFRMQIVPIACEGALQNIDYGIYQNFPFYRIIVLCHNETVQTYTVVQSYRSGEYKVLPSFMLWNYDTSKQKYGKLSVSYSYGVGTYTSLVYRQVSDANSSYLLYWEKYYRNTTAGPMRIRSAQIASSFKISEQALKIVDIAFNVDQYSIISTVSQGNLLYDHNKNAPFTNNYSPITRQPGPFTIFRVVRICYTPIFIEVSKGDGVCRAAYQVWSKESRNFTLVNMCIFPCKKDSFEVIGSSGRTLYMRDSGSQFSLTLLFKGDESFVFYDQYPLKTVTDYYFSDELCSTGIHYEDGKTVAQCTNIYPFSSKTTGSPRMEFIFLPRDHKNIIQYVEINNRWLIVASSTSDGKNITLSNFNFKESGGKGVLITLPDATTALNLHLSPGLLHVIFKATNGSSGYLQIMLEQTKSRDNPCIKPGFPYYFQEPLQFPVSLQSYISAGDYGFDATYMAKTTFQKNAFAHFHVMRNSTSKDFSVKFSYPFEFEANGYTPCLQSINSKTPNAIILHRLNSNNTLDILEAGIRNNDTYVLESYHQIEGDSDNPMQNIKCWWDGIAIMKKRSVQFRQSNMGFCGKTELQFAINKDLDQVSKKYYYQQVQKQLVDLRSISDPKYIFYYQGQILKTPSPAIPAASSGSSFIFRDTYDYLLFVSEPDVSKDLQES